MQEDKFRLQTYLVRKKVMKLFGAAFHIYNPAGQLLFYSKMKAFKLKEDIRLYTGEDMKEEVLWIQARQILDFSAAYDVVDSKTQQKIGAFRRKGMQSILRDEWHILDSTDKQIGTIKEDSMALALVRRFLTNLIPQKFSIELNGAPVATYKQNFNPFVLKLTLDFSQDTKNQFDHRLGIAAALLLGSIEGRQG